MSHRFHRPLILLASSALAAAGVVAVAPAASATYGDPTQTSYTRNVLVIKYIPVADNRKLVAAERRLAGSLRSP